MSTPPQQPVKTFVENLDVRESFADSIRSVTFMDNVWRFEFTANRMQEPKPQEPPPIMVTPTCRLALTAQAGLELLNQLTQLVQILEQQGTIKRNQPPPPSVMAPSSKTPH